MLSQEQKDALKKVGRAMGVDLLALVGEAEDATKYLEELGIAHKTQKPQGFWAQFKEAITPTRTKVLPDAKPTLPKVLGNAFRAANSNAMGGADVIGPMVKQAGKRNEGLEERVKARVKADGFADILTLCASIATQLTDLDHRLSNLEESRKAWAGFPWPDIPTRPTVNYDIELSPGGNGKKAKGGKPFNWDLFGKTYFGRPQ